MRIRRATLFAAAILNVMGGMAFAQGREGHDTKILKIHLLDYEDEDCKHFKIVVLRQDKADEPLRGAEKIGGCKWRLVMEDTYNTALTSFSVRVQGIARTKCKLASWNSDEGGFGSVELAPYRDVLQITLRPDDLKSLWYVRRIVRDDDYVECWQTGDLLKGSSPWVLQDAHDGIEELRLPNFFTGKDGCGLFVNDLPTVKNARRKKYNMKPLTEDEIAAAAAAQANSGTCNIPTQVEGLLDILSKGSVRLRKLYLKVE